MHDCIDVTAERLALNVDLQVVVVGVALEVKLVAEFQMAMRFRGNFEQDFEMTFIPVHHYRISLSC